MPGREPDSDTTLFGRLAVGMGLVTAEHVADCLDLQRRLAQGGRKIALGKILLAKGYLAAGQIERILEAQSRRPVRCASCGADFGMDFVTGSGPVRCPQCLRRLLAAALEDREPGPEATQDLTPPPIPPGPGTSLHIEPAEGPPVDLDVPPGGRIEVGRSPEGPDGVDVMDPALSRRHCAISEEAGRLFVEDLGSRNGTFVNGERVVRRPLRPGDEIEIGASRILVRSPRSVAHTRDNTTAIWRAEGLCMLCGVVVSAEDIEAGRSQKTDEGLLCERCLEFALVPGRVLGGYRIIEQIGFGGMAEIYRAERVEGGLIVALKTLIDPQDASEVSRKRFVQEARATARLEHPNLIRVFDAGEESGIPYIVMEYIAGEDLAAVLDRRGYLAVDEALDIALDIANALSFAHSHGVIHRDVKPGNIILDSVYKRARLVDLGVAKVHDSSDEQRLTRTGTGLGTLEYAAPEQIESASSVDARADVYSLGATVFRMVVGSRPFAGRNEIRLAEAILRKPLVWPQDAVKRIPKKLREVVAKAMSKKPSGRYASADELRDALAGIREALG